MYYIIYISIYMLNIEVENVDIYSLVNRTLGQVLIED